MEPPAGTVSRLDSVTVTFSEPVTGNGFSDLLVNGRPSTGISGSGSIYKFEFDPPPVGVVRFGWDPGARIVDFGSPPNLFNVAEPGAEWAFTFVDTVPPVMKLVNPAPGTTVRALSQTELVFSESVSGVDAGDLLINGSAATSVSGSGPGPYIFKFEEPALGAVTVVWTGAHGIRDESSPPNAFAGGAWNYTVDPNFATAPVRLNEILASYSGNLGLADEDGEFQDWIELFNHSASPVNLQGWSLTDEADEPGKWIFPSIVLGPLQFLIVFASGKDRRPTGVGAKVHKNFKLGMEGELLALFNGESPRALVSAFAPRYPEQRSDHSYGYDSDGALRYFATPTPGASNGASTIGGVVPALRVDRARGVYRAPVAVQMETSIPGAVTRYTTDGREPGSTSGMPS